MGVFSREIKKRELKTEMNTLKKRPPTDRTFKKETIRVIKNKMDRTEIIKYWSNSTDRLETGPEECAN